MIQWKKKNLFSGTYQIKFIIHLRPWKGVKSLEMRVTC